MSKRKKYTILLSMWSVVGMLYLLFGMEIPVSEITDSLWVPFEPKSPKIFFLETSSKTNLNGRQACAVESTALKNPNTNVIVYFTSPSIDDDDDYTRMLLNISNVHFKHLDTFRLLRGTPLYEWYKNGKWRRSRYNVTHRSDALRLALLWKYGGIYLDLDVVVMRSLSGLKNCLGRESDVFFNGAAMIFDQRHNFLRKCMIEFAAKYNSSDWSSNGPVLLTRVLQRECRQKYRQITWQSCNGVTALPVDAFYAIPYYKWRLFFDDKNADKVVEMWKNSYLIHVWNKMSSIMPVVIGSGQPYELAIKEYCPSVYAMNAGNKFL